MNKEKVNFFIFTGGPGAGKTAVLDELKQRGFTAVPEVARTIIKKQQELGGNALHTGDRNAFCDLMLKASIDDYMSHLDSNEILFFDRGIPDLYGYAKTFCGGVSSAILDAVNQYRYNSKIFIFPPWIEIYCHDTERKQDFEEAIATYQAVKEGGIASGYQVVEVPKGSIIERADFILKTLKLF